MPIMNLKLIASFGLFIVIYSSLNVYIGWNIHQWFKITLQFDNPILIGIFILNKSIQISGRKDKTDRNRLSIDQLIDPASTLPKLVLDHQPLELNEIMNQGADILIGGHTHQGQIAPNRGSLKRSLN